jgi:hypothetical protein
MEILHRNQDRREIAVLSEGKRHGDASLSDLEGFPLVMSRVECASRLRAALGLVGLFLCGACRKEPVLAAQVTVTIANGTVATGLEGTWLQDGQTAWVISRRGAVVTLAVPGNDELAKNWRVRMQNPYATEEGVQVDVVFETTSVPHPFSGVVNRYVLTPQSDGTLRQSGTNNAMPNVLDATLRRQ